MADGTDISKRKKRKGLQQAAIDHSIVLQPSKNREYIVPVLCHALQIMEVLHDKKSGLKLEEIHQATGVSKSTVYQIIRTLVAKRYVQRDCQALYRWSLSAE